MWMLALHAEQPASATTAAGTVITQSARGAKGKLDTKKATGLASCQVLSPGIYIAP
jgi:hypothetical protein